MLCLGCTSPSSSPLSRVPLTLASGSSGSSGLAQARLRLPLRSLVLTNGGEPPWDEVSDSFCKMKVVGRGGVSSPPNPGTAAATHHSIDAVAQRLLGDHDEVGDDAFLLQVLAA